MSYHILGDEDTVLGFGFAGVPGTAVDNRQAATEIFATLVSDPVLKVLIMTYPVAAMLEPEVTAHRLASGAPYVVEIPDLWKTRVVRRTLVEMIQEAVGIKIAPDAK